MTPLRIAIADDDPLFRKGLAVLLGLQPHIEVVAEIERFEDLDAVLDATRCDLLLLYLQVPRTGLPRLRSLATRLPIIAITGSDRLAEALEIIASGVRGLVLRRLAVDTLVEAIAVVVSGQVSVPPVLQTHVLRSYRENADIPLTRREREITCLVAQGLRNLEVARKLCISEPTVKTHLNNIFHKIEVRDRVELTLWAARAGLVGVHDASHLAAGAANRSAA